MTIEGLIAALEKATEADRELDEDIMLAAYPDLGLRRGFGDNWYSSGGIHVRVEPYTASLDAALTLVPDYWATLISINETGPGGASLTKGFLLVQAKHSEPAIALCIAALKARGDAA